MKIKHLYINNLRGLSDVSFEFDKPTNIIVGPNAIGKTTVLEAIRLVKTLLCPRYPQEGSQVLVSLGAVSPHPQLSNYLAYEALARDPAVAIRIVVKVEIEVQELQFLQTSPDKVALEVVRGKLARTDEQGQFAMTQYLSSDEGRDELKKTLDDVRARLSAMSAPHETSLELRIDPQTGNIGGIDPFGQVLIAILERNCVPAQSLFSYFPADRAFPSGEVNIQIGSNEASAQIQAHMGQAGTKYQRLKQTIVNTVVTSNLDGTSLEADFKRVFTKLMPGKELAGISVTPVGTLKVAVREIAAGTARIFDIDSMSSGEKGLILTFMLLMRTVAPGGIALLDEPELHLNPAVCKNIIPFLMETLVAEQKLQLIICTHSPEILGAAFDSSECTIHHLRSANDSTKIYKQDSKEIFDALRRLGTTPAETLFSKGNIFVEGEHDAAVLEAGFNEQIAGFKITGLGGRNEVEKEIATLQKGEGNLELGKLSCFIFDLDRAPTKLKSSGLVRVVQWDRYCLENYLLSKVELFDELSSLTLPHLGSRGTFEKRVVELAMSQLKIVIASEVYKSLEPENAGLRPDELASGDYSAMAEVLATRIDRISDGLRTFDSAAWRVNFVDRCNALDGEKRGLWENGWSKVCNGKKLIDDLYREYTIGISKLDFKRRLVVRMRTRETEDWTLVRSKLRDLLGP